LIQYSVIVPVWNAAHDLDACLQALLDQSVPADTYEVIIVDDGSTDNSAEVAGRYPVCVIRQQHHGPASARNAGARQAQGRFLLFTDADCVPVQTWIEEIVRPLEANCHVAACKGVYRTQQRGLIPRIAQVEFEEKYANLRRHTSIDFVDTGSAAFRADAFWGAGAFDTSFPVPSNEDTQLSFTLASQGWQLMFAEGAVVEHRHSQTLAQYLRRKWRHGFWRVKVYHRYPRKMTGDSYTPRSLQVQMACATLTTVFAPFPVTRRLAAVTLGCFLLATLPFVRRAKHFGRDVAAFVPVVLFMRALALCAGLATGALEEVAPMRSSGTQQCMAPGVDAQS
jgi:glycosyltransferase involved in cell wall biosynthesis